MIIVICSWSWSWLLLSGGVHTLQPIHTFPNFVVSYLLNRTADYPPCFILPHAKDIGLDQRTEFFLDEFRNVAYRHIMEEGLCSSYILSLLLF